MRIVDPANVFRGVLVFVVPHMDDEVIGCGGTISMLSSKEKIHIIYATNGARSPRPTFSSKIPDGGYLCDIRRREAHKALDILGVPVKNAHFLNFPDGDLRTHLDKLSHTLSKLIALLQPDHIFIPFRYDRHADHLALNQATHESLRRSGSRAQVNEYFVYHRWQLLSKGDIRKYITQNHLIKIDAHSHSTYKKKALRSFHSQTTIFYEWQDRPILTENLIEETCHEPEFFLRYNPAFPGASIFAHAKIWIRVAHHLEPFMKEKKDKAVALGYSIFKRKSGKAV